MYKFIVNYEEDELKLVYVIFFSNKNDHTELVGFARFLCIMSQTLKSC